MTRAAKAKPPKRDEKLDQLVAAVVAARAEYFQRKAAFDELKPFMGDAIRKADEADNALQDYLSSLCGGSPDRYLDECE